jgi:hypothetical protein
MQASGGQSDVRGYLRIWLWLRGSKASSLHAHRPSRMLQCPPGWFETLRSGWTLHVARSATTQGQSSRRSWPRRTRLDDLLEVLLDAPDVCAQVEQLEVEPVLRSNPSGRRPKETRSLDTHIDLLHLPSDLCDVLLRRRRAFQRGEFLLDRLQTIQVGGDLEQSASSNSVRLISL